MSARVAELNREIAERTAELVELLAGEPPPVASPPAAPAWLSIDDFAARLSMSPKTVRRLMEEGMPFSRPRRRHVRINVAEAEAWIAKRPGQPAPLDSAAGDVR